MVVTMCEEVMATHPSILAWRTWTEEVVGLQSMRSQKKKKKIKCVKLVLFLL